MEPLGQRGDLKLIYYLVLIQEIQIQGGGFGAKKMTAANSLLEIVADLTLAIQDETESFAYLLDQLKEYPDQEISDPINELATFCHDLSKKHVSQMKQKMLIQVAGLFINLFKLHNFACFYESQESIAFFLVSIRDNAHSSYIRVFEDQILSFAYRCKVLASTESNPVLASKLLMTFEQAISSLSTFVKGALDFDTTFAPLFKRLASENDDAINKQLLRTLRVVLMQCKTNPHYASQTLGLFDDIYQFFLNTLFTQNSDSTVSIELFSMLFSLQPPEKIILFYKSCIDCLRLSKVDEEKVRAVLLMTSLVDTNAVDLALFYDALVDVASFSDQLKKHVLKFIDHCSPLVLKNGHSFTMKTIDILRAIDKGSGAQKLYNSIIMSFSTPDTYEFMIDIFLTKVILSLKDPNQKTRQSASEILLKWARLSGDDVTEKLILRILACLASKSTHMISAAILACSIITDKFAALIGESMLVNIFNTVLVVCKSSSTETKKSCVEFISIAYKHISADIIVSNLSQIIDSLLFILKTKAFTLSIRSLFLGLIQKVGLPTMQRSFPKEHAAYLFNLQKRSAKNHKQGRKGRINK